jgi:hypothetical protein
MVSNSPVTWLPATHPTCPGFAQADRPRPVTGVMLRCRAFASDWGPLARARCDLWIAPRLRNTATGGSATELAGEPAGFLRPSVALAD